MDIKYIGKNIVKLRLSRELSQADLGKEIGLTPSAISNIENSISYPSVDTLIRFADYFSVSMMDCGCGLPNGRLAGICLETGERFYS